MMSQPKSRDSRNTTTVTDGVQRDYLPAERRDMILSLLTRQNVVTVPELAKLFTTTEITVRRDLGELADAGLVRRIRGGAMSVGDGIDPSTRKVTTTRSAVKSTPSITASVTSAEGTTTTSDSPSANYRIIKGPTADGIHPSIGVMLPEPSFFWPGVIAYMETAVKLLGFEGLIVRESSYDEGSPDDEIIKELDRDPNVFGLIVAPNSHPQSGQKAWEQIKHVQNPIVVIERDQPLFGSCYVDSVRTNHPYGVRKAAVHFLDRGHTRIGAAFSETPTSAIIQKSWRELVNDSDGRIVCPFICDGIQPYDSHGVDEIVDQIIDTNVTAMLVHSDYLAIAIAQVLQRRGKRVPDDVSLISIDGFATPSSRPLTVLRSSARDLAETAVQTLAHRIREADAAIQHVFVDPMLIDRGSVADRTRS